VTYTHKDMSKLILIMFFFGLARTDITISFRVLLWTVYLRDINMAERLKNRNL
jgi:hypothetical protein